MSLFTVFLGKLIGLGLLLMCAALAARPKASLATISAMMNEPGLLLVTGIVTMTAGLALVVGHNLWRGPPLVLAVTIVGWASFFKGLAIIAVPPAQLASFYRAVNYPGRFGTIMVLGAVAGAWMAWMAFVATPQVQL